MCGGVSVRREVTYIDIAGVDVIGAAESWSHYQPHTVHVHCGVYTSGIRCTVIGTHEVYIHCIHVG